ncbi:MAG: thiamine diphosphokinase [Anaerolineae bacterium]|nr:thiamine diphosphokinase [Anaerolineae bacterium]
MQTDKAIIFANGEINDGLMVRRALEHASSARLIAADGGAHVAERFGITPQVIIGDMDSVDEQQLEHLIRAGIEVYRHPPAKNETDLELALLYAVERGVRWIRVIGAIGGRLDQTLSNVYLLALPELRPFDVRLVSGNEEALLMWPGTLTIVGAKGDTVSLLPVSGVARGIRTESLLYPLKSEELLFGPARGVSNEMHGDSAQVHLREGALLVLHTIGHA